LKTIAGPDVAVITAISPVHVENYPSFEALVEEKASLGDKVRTVVLNADDHLVAMMAGRFVGARVLTYGYAEVLFAQADGLGSDFYEFVVFNVFQGAFQVHVDRWGEGV
jgi:UDP-N-acetylmuramyl pentapeptide synthase